MEQTQSKIKYEVGKIYEFTVTAIYYDFCELVDEYGFNVYLQHIKGLDLSKGQKIKCMVTANYQKRPKIEFVESEKKQEAESKITLERIRNIINYPQKQWNTEKFPALLLAKDNENQSFEELCRRWIERLRNEGADLKSVKKDCTEFMEQSEFLGLCSAEERDFYQKRLTEIIECIGIYVGADKLIKANKEKDFVQDIFNKLEKTGYVYHPENEFETLSVLYQLNRELMEETVPSLFDIIRKWPEEIWEKQPLNDLIIKLLKQYVEGNIWTVGRSSDNGRVVKSLVQALGIAYIIAGNRKDVGTVMTDEREILSRLCVLSSYIGDFNNKELLSLSVSELLSEKYFRPRFSLEDTSAQEIPLVLKKQSSLVKDWPVETSNCFLADRLRLTISKDGIAVWSDSPKAKSVIPEKFNLWGDIQVYADRSYMPPMPDKLTVNSCKRLWEAIERDLFTKSPISDTRESARKVVNDVHGVGDTVCITITGVDEMPENDRGDNKAFCTIEGEKKESGYIYGRDIVSYMHHLSLWMFQDENGKPLLLEAKIIGVDSDGVFHFSMMESIKEFVCSRFSYGDEVICSLGAKRKERAENKLSPAITEDGYSVSLTGALYEDLERGDIVKATYLGKANGDFHLLCSLQDRSDGNPVDLVKAFHNLLDRYAFADDDDIVEEETTPSSQLVDLENTDRIIGVEYVRELIRIIDRMAVLDDDYIRSYNYIAFNRVLCRMTGWDDRAEYYRGRLQLIEMLYDFAINDKVDTSQLELLQGNDSELFRSDTKMHEKFQQLQIISYMGGQSHDDELMYYRRSTQGQTRQIASLAIAYNILLENNMKPQANDILNQVKNKLSLNGYESNLKIYAGGIESKTVEFKTSIVYPPANNGYPNIQEQTHTILSVIASFLNSDGGTLYIGVNDSGAGVGIYDDLCYKEFNGDMDKYQRYVLDQVAGKWGNSVAAFVNTGWDYDDKSGKYVLLVSVSPYPKGVSLDGEWLYRNGSGNRHLTEDEFREYNEMRQIRLERNLKEQNIVNKEGVAVKEDADTHEQASTNPKPAVVLEEIKTSSRRKNVLVDYKEGYIPYAACLKFLPNCKFKKMTEYDFQTDSKLTLPVYDDDIKEGYLLLGYEEGSIAKVPVREIMKFEDYRAYSCYNGSKLLFVAIAFEGDGLITVTEEGKAGHRKMVRIDSVSKIDKCRLSDCGSRVFNEGIASKVLGYEIAPSAEMPEVKNILDKDARTLGFPLKTVSQDVKRKLSDWGVI